MRIQSGRFFGRFAAQRLSSDRRCRRQEAIKTSERLSTPIQLLLTDLAMPHMNGRQLAAHIGRNRPEMKILYVSGHLESAALKEELEKEGAGFLPKPFLPDALLRAVRDVLDKAS